MHLFKSGFLLLPLTLCACVSQPIFNWRTDDVRALRKNPISISNSLQYLDSARDGYRQAIEVQMTQENMVSRTLIVGSGALLTAAGLKAPADTLLVGGATIGTVYGLGSTELPRARVNAYLAGIDALNCAEASVVAIRVTDVAQLKSAVDDLDNRLYSLQAALQALRNFVAAAGGNVSGSKEVVKSAQTTVKGATTVITSTREFLVKTNMAAVELLNQVDKIDKSVSVAVATATPDLSQVKVTSSGLGSSISAIVAKAVSNANASRSATSSPVKPQSGGRTASLVNFTDYTNAVEQEQDATNQAMRRVKALLPPNFEALDTTTLITCGITPVPSPFVANPVELDFTAKKADSFDVDLSGGTKEYVIDMATVPKGLTVTAPGKDGSVLKVALDAAADVVPDKYELHLHDQTPGGNGVIINITINAAAPTANIPATQAPAKKTNNSLSQAKPKTPTTKATDLLIGMNSVKVGNKTIKINGASESASDKSIIVSLCSPYQNSDKDAVLAQLQQDLKIKGVTTKLDVQRDPKCL